jgi:hypothetical protein
MIRGSVLTDRKYFNFDNAEPQFPCATPECDAVAWEPCEFHECIVCKRRFCADCLVAIGGEKYCPEHAVCACGAPAIDSCMECGAVLCGGCLGDFTECKSCRRSGPDPDDLPAEAYDPDNARCL